ncbi:MAG: rhomboid family intramembrane serine protease [Eubacterium sp.]
MKYRKDIPIITIVLIILNLIVFFAMELMGSTEETGFLFDHGAMYVPAVLDDGEWYRVITHMFMHSGAEHILNNMVMLGILGYQMEKEYGCIKYLITYFVCGIGATIVSGMGDMLIGQYSVSVGASGAIMGLFGALLVMVFKNRRQFEQVSSGPRLIILFIIMVFGNMEEGVDWMAHLGGAVTGVIMAFIIYRPKRETYFQL